MLLNSSLPELYWLLNQDAFIFACGCVVCQCEWLYKSSVNVCVCVHDCLCVLASECVYVWLHMCMYYVFYINTWKKWYISIFINLRYLQLKLLKKRRKCVMFFIVTSKIFLMKRVVYHWKGFILLYLMMDFNTLKTNWPISVFAFKLFTCTEI